MSTQTAARVPIIHAGAPASTASSNAEGWEAIEVHFHFHRFARMLNLPAPERTPISPEFKCLGHNWALGLQANGELRDGVCSLLLWHKSSGKIRIRFAINIKKGNFRRKNDVVIHDAEYSGKGFGDLETVKPFVKFAKNSDVAKDLVDGALIIELRMMRVDPSERPALFVAENPLQKNILNKFMDEESADMVFEVTYESAATSPKRTKACKKFYAHRFILQECHSALGELCKSGGGSGLIPISDVKPEIFHHLLFYIYGGKVPDDFLKENAKKVIDAADRYGVVGLKLEAEAAYVSSTAIAMDDVMDNLLFADSKNCALLKEAAMEFLVKNRAEAVRKLSFENVPGSLMSDLLMAVDREIDDGGAGNAGDLGTMRVNELRKMLHEKGLDVDGSREMMIARLQEPTSDGDSN